MSAKPDGRYPFVYRDHQTWGKIGVSFAGGGVIQFTTLLENKPGGMWRVVDMTPDEAEQMALRILERVATARKTGA